MTDLLVIALMLVPSLAAVVYTVALAIRTAMRARRRRRRRLRGMTEAEVADVLGTFGVDISVWPARAPRNGATEETP
jgi:hypothetical protein